MRELKKLFENNREWVESKLAVDPVYFTDLAKEQKPRYLWIGCSDSRVPANQVVGLGPGEIFVHRNVANLFVHTDLNCLSVLQYAVDYLQIEHIIICGHYGCGGVAAAMENQQFGLVDNWLRNIRDVYANAHEEFSTITDQKRRYDRLVELNVIQQVKNVCHTTVVQNAWARNQHLAVHGWVYDLESGLLQDMNYCISGPEQVEKIYHYTDEIFLW